MHRLTHTHVSIYTHVTRIQNQIKIDFMKCFCVKSLMRINLTGSLKFSIVRIFLKAFTWYNRIWFGCLAVFCYFKCSRFLLLWLLFRFETNCSFYNNQKEPKDTCVDSNFIESKGNERRWRKRKEGRMREPKTKRAIEMRTIWME